MSRLLLILAATLLARAAHAQVACDAQCTQTVELTANDQAFDGSAVAAGSTVCLHATATAGSVRISGLSGTTAMPITVRPCGNVLQIGTPQSGQSGVQLTDCQHVRLTGGGGAAERALHIVGPSNGGAELNVGIWLDGCSSDVELDHLEVEGTGYTALRNYSEVDSCQVRRGFQVHDNYFHDLGGEGMFQGINDASKPYRVLDVVVSNNRIERSGFQGIKIGTTVDSGCRIEGNVVLLPGFSHTAGEDTGITAGSNCVIRRNLVVNATADAIFLNQPNLTHDIEDNILVGPTADITLQTNGAHLIVAHNTIVGSTGMGLLLYGDGPVQALYANNLIVGAGTAQNYQSGAQITVMGNLELPSTAAAMFASDETGTVPFELMAGSPAVNAGAVVADLLAIDYAGRNRSDGTPDVGAEEFGAMFSPDAGPTDDAGSGAADGGHGRDPDPSASCGCVIGGKPRGARTGLALLAMALLVLARRRRS